MNTPIQLLCSQLGKLDRERRNGSEHKRCERERLQTFNVFGDATGAAIAEKALPAD